MFRKLWQRWLKRSKNLLANRRPMLEILEDRFAPAVLDSIGIGIVTYTAGGGIANSLTISTDGTDYTLTDTAETISLTAGAIAAGWTGGGTNTVTGPNINVFSIEVDTLDLNDAVTANSIEHPLDIDTGTDVGNTVLVGGVVGVGAQAINSPVTVSSTGGAVALFVDDLDNSGPVFAQLDADKVRDLRPYDISFTPVDLSSLDVLGGSGGNIFIVNDTVAGITTTLEGGMASDVTIVLASTGTLAYEAAGGTDDVFLGDSGLTANLAGAIDVSAGSGGTVNLTVDDSADVGNVAATVTSTGVTGLTPGGVTWVGTDLSYLSLNSGFGDDALTVITTPNAGSLTTQINGGEGDDTYLMSLAASSNTLIDDPLDDDTIDFTGAAAGVTIDMDSVASQTISAGNTLQFAAASIIENFVGSNFADDITLDAIPAARNIAGGLPTTPPGDTMHLDLTGTTGAALSVLGIGSGQWTFTSPHGNIDYTGIETLDTMGALYDLIIDMALAGFQDGTGDYVDVELNAATTRFQVRISNTYPVPALPIFFEDNFAGASGVQSFTLLASTDDTGLIVNSVNTRPIPVNGVVFTGNTGNDRLEFTNGATYDVTYTPDAATTGSGSVAQSGGDGDGGFHERGGGGCAWDVVGDVDDAQWGRRGDGGRRDELHAVGAVQHRAESEERGAVHGDERRGGDDAVGGVGQ